VAAEAAAAEVAAIAAAEAALTEGAAPAAPASNGVASATQLAGTSTARAAAAAAAPSTSLDTRLDQLLVVLTAAAKAPETQAPGVDGLRALLAAAPTAREPRQNFARNLVSLPAWVQALPAAALPPCPPAAIRFLVRLVLHVSLVCVCATPSKSWHQAGSPVLCLDVQPALLPRRITSN